MLREGSLSFQLMTIAAANDERESEMTELEKLRTENRMLEARNRRLETENAVLKKLKELERGYR